MAKTLETILYVEDSPYLRSLAQLVLEKMGDLTVKMCESGEDALQSVQAFRPDLILLDVMMPGMDGPTTLAALREIPAMKDVPVIFMTGKAEPGDMKLYRDLGALDVIRKPFEPMTLAEQVLSIWSRAQE